jgi:hypothetical protein
MPRRPTTKVDPNGRECTQCSTYKPWSEFSPEPNQKSGYHSACKPCRRTLHAAYYRRNADAVKMRTTSANMVGERKAKFRAYQKKYFRRKKDAKATRLRPDVCEICGRHGNKHKKNGIVFDHDHDTGKFRGWICSYCNVAIGMMEENIDYLNKVIQYLEESKKQNTENAPV